MRHALALIIPLIGADQVHAQSPSCDALPISYDPLGIVFTEGTLSFGDSVIIIPITNTSATDMAYPQAKLVPLTPLPPGMIQNSHWETFASSWNAGITMPANCFFDVTLPIPLDYMVTFELWVNNLTPLLTGDSCHFDDPFTINLNPTATGIAALDRSRSLLIWPLPAADRLHVMLPDGLSTGRLTITNIIGEEAIGMSVDDGDRGTVIEVDGLSAGTYVLSVTPILGPTLRQSILIAR